jgi:branched-chain amino acid aminotransferase
MRLANGATPIPVARNRPEELSTFSECFIVGNAAEVTPVGENAEHRPGAIAFQLMDRYARLVGARSEIQELAPA